MNLCEANALKNLFLRPNSLRGKSSKHFWLVCVCVDKIEDLPCHFTCKVWGEEISQLTRRRCSSVQFYNSTPPSPSNKVIYSSFSCYHRDHESAEMVYMSVCRGIHLVIQGGTTTVPQWLKARWKHDVVYVILKWFNSQPSRYVRRCWHTFLYLLFAH